MVLLILSYVISSMMVAFMLPHILILSLRKRLVDPIDSRKVHSVPASRLGGVTLFPSLLFSSWFCIAAATIMAGFVDYKVNINVEMVLETLSLLLLFMTGVYDDVIGVSYKKKFVVQILAAMLITASGTYFTTLHGLFGIYEIAPAVGVPLSILFLVFVTNALNLIDGIDGLASMLSIMALFVYGVLLYSCDMMTDALIAVATLGALVPFFYSNVFGIKRGARSKIFMGDAGALVIGAILGFTAMSIWNVSLDVDSGEPIDHRYYILAFTMLLVPCLDVLRIVLHRYRIKKPLFKPDKNHFHHKLMALGMSPRRALSTIIMINIAFVALNIGLSYFVNVTYIFVVDIAVWSLMHKLITQRIEAVSKRG